MAVDRTHSVRLEAGMADELRELYGTDLSTLLRNVCKNLIRRGRERKLAERAQAARESVPVAVDEELSK